MIQRDRFKETQQNAAMHNIEIPDSAGPDGDAAGGVDVPYSEAFAWERSKRLNAEINNRG